jgi:hypothetical protein
VAAAIASRGLLKAARLAGNATAANGPSGRKPIATSTPASKAVAPKARASSAVAEAIKKAREEKRASARASASGRSKHSFRRGAVKKDRSSFPDVEIFLPASMAETTSSDTTSSGGSDGEQVSASANGDAVGVNATHQAADNDDADDGDSGKENARDHHHQCLNGPSPSSSPPRASKEACCDATIDKENVGPNVAGSRISCHTPEDTAPGC